MIQHEQQELENLLTNFATSHSMSLKEVTQQANMILTRENILKQHKSPISQNEKDQRWRTRLPNGKQLVKTRREDLLDAIVSYYSSLPQETAESSMQVPPAQQESTPVAPVLPTYGHADQHTLRNIYPEWLKLRKTEVCQNTLADDIKNWQDYIAPKGIADIPLPLLTRAKLKAWACQIVSEYSMKKKYYNNIRTVLNSLLDYAVDEEYIETNKYRSIKLNSRRFKPRTFREANEEAFTRQEQELVIREAEMDSLESNSAIPLGICILFHTGMRIGELCGLRYGDIDGDYLYIRRMLVEKQEDTATGLKHGGYEIVEHAKTSAGNRRIYLTQKTREYFRRVRELNRINGFPDSDTDLIFQRAGGLCNQRVFDSRLKKYCNPNHLNLPYAKSCHDIRRSYISALFDSSMNPDAIRRIAGHENIEMTMKYCRGRDSQEELAQMLEQLEAAGECNKRCNKV